MIKEKRQVNDIDIESFDGVSTVGELRQALGGVADDMPLFDGMGQSVLVSIFRPEIQPAFVEVQ